MNTHTRTQSTQTPGPLAIGLASRSFSNEAAGKEMFASLSRDGVVCAYIPHTASGREILPLLAAAPELLAALQSLEATANDHVSRLEDGSASNADWDRYLNATALARAAIAKARGGAL